MGKRKSDAGSYKDPSGHVFYLDGTVYRQVNLVFKEDYDRFVGSHLMERLVSKGMLIPAEDVTASFELTDDAYRVLRPERIPFITYPYEWSFSMLKDAAILTLDIEREALACGMTLRDASAYNIQFLRGKPILIDTLSFEPYHEGSPWVAYGQFCRHFLAPLALMAHVDVRLSRLLEIHLDGIPLDFASRLLARKTALQLGLNLHIHVHARSIAAAQSRPASPPRGSFSKTAMLALVDSLGTTVRKLSWDPRNTTWADYYQCTNYPPSAFEEKKRLVRDYLQRCGPGNVIDLGANDGMFSRIAAASGRFTVSADSDPAAVEKNYLMMKRNAEANILPVLIDVMNPSPPIGWANEERASFFERAGNDSTVMALALVHHLAIGQNVPLEMIASYLSRIGNDLIVEFVPKEDTQVRGMLALRKDVFPGYSRSAFEAILARYAAIEEASGIGDSLRTLIRSRRK